MREASNEEAGIDSRRRPRASLVGLGVKALASAFERGGASPTHACDLYLERIAHHDAKVGAYVAIDADRARRDAADSTRRWACGTPRSPIDGVPLAIKSNIAVRGLPWTAGIGAWRDRIAAEDAACVERLRAAGAVILGTVNMDPGALGARTDNPWYGRTCNPHRLDHSAGGSSGGSAAAVAAGLCAAALGTDTMGSVRIPAAACGIVGLVPPADAIDRRGVVPLAPPFDRIGMLARSIDDVSALLDVFAAPESADAANDLPLALHFPAELSGSGEAAQAGYHRLHDRLVAAGWTLEQAALARYDADHATDRLLRLVEVEGSVVYRDLLANDPDALGPHLCGLLRWGEALSQERRVEASRTIAAARSILNEAMTGCAGLLSPSIPHPPVAFDAPPPKNTAWFTAMASITDLPAIALPWEPDDAGLPRSLQLIAPTTAAVLRLGRRIGLSLDGIAPPPAFRW